MNCLPFEEDIARYVDGSLDADGVRSVVEHLRECPDCAAFAEAMEGDRQALRAEPPEMADVDFVGLRAGIRRRIVERPWPVRWMPALLAAAAILVLVLWRPWIRPGVEVARVGPPIAVKSERPLPNGRGSAPSRAATVRERRTPRAAKIVRKPAAPVVPQPDPALEAALQEFLAAEKAPKAMPEPSPDEIRIVSSDANVVLILLQQTSGASYE
jgi:hypothetical protein